MQEYNTEVLIIGAGPAGAVAALNLAPFKSVIMVDKLAQPKERIGESLSPYARPLLADMGLLEQIDAQNHYPYYGNQSCWGSSIVEEYDFLRSLNGHGWHLDRPLFEKLLRYNAKKRGAQIIAPATVIALERGYKIWQVTLLENNKHFRINAKVIINASGRASLLENQLKAKRIYTDRLVSGWIVIENKNKVQGLSFIEATPSGWWYSAAIPKERRIASFQTDSDLKEAVEVRHSKQLLNNALKGSILSKFINNESQPIIYKHGYTAANSGILVSCIGPDWIATGDAAVCFDPLSSQGLFNAIYTGLAAAEAINSYLDGNIGALRDYQEIISSIWRAYQRHLKYYYSSEKRFNDEPFWARRINS